MSSRLNRDIIYGDIELDPLASLLIDTPIMQRLRRINQLGFSDLVFDGARHSRLSHCKGVYQLVKRLFKSIEENHARFGKEHPGELLDQRKWGSSPSERWKACGKVCAWAGLLHDVTHIPFGHTLEDEFYGLYAKHDALESPRHQHLWGFSQSPSDSNIVSVMHNRSSEVNEWIPDSLRPSDLLVRLIHIIILYKVSSNEKEPFSSSIDRRKSELLKADTPTDQLRQDPLLIFLQKKLDDYNTFTRDGLFHPFMTEIISDTICADLLDYLERDTRYTGLRSSYDPRIVTAFTIVNVDGAICLALASSDKSHSKRFDVLSDVISLMRLRHDLALKVYYHKTKTCAGAMLTTAMQLLNERPKDGSPDDPDSITHFTMTDEGLLTWLRNKATRSLDSVRPDDKSQLSLDIHDGNEVITYKRKNGHPKLALSLLNSLLQRRLHKVLVSASFELFWSKFDRQAQHIDLFRKEARNISNTIAEKCNLDDSDIILFIPPYKEKAKEVEARAVKENGTVEKLCVNQDIKDDIANINNSYAKLWHLYLFVAPYVCDDPVLCSQIIDCLDSCIASKLPSGHNAESTRSFCRKIYLEATTRNRIKALEQVCQLDWESDKLMLNFILDNDEFSRFQEQHGLDRDTPEVVLAIRQTVNVAMEYDIDRLSTIVRSEVTSMKNRERRSLTEYVNALSTISIKTYKRIK